MAGTARGDTNAATSMWVTPASSSDSINATRAAHVDRRFRLQPVARAHLAEVDA